ncbi:MAG: DctP family TRAP transporter solute-binding subunit [Deltaproteobacteria bacterium]|nr:DctP family TRAP transporter solute-binding subunit [Deltaproteobacteria bacterium]
MKTSKKMGMALLGLSLLLPAGMNGYGKAEAADGKVVIKFSHVVVENTPKHQAAAKFKELLEKRSNGKFEVQIFPSSQLYGEKEELEALQANNVQFIAPLATRLIGFNEAFQIGDLPFLFKDDKAAYTFFTGKYGDKLLTSLQDKGILGMTWLLNASKQLANIKREIRKPDDVKGLKLRTASGGLIEDQNNALGAGSQTVAWGEMYQTLQNKTVDGLENTLNNFDTAKLYEVLPYLSITNHGRMDYVILTNTKFWGSLNAEQQKLVKQAMKDATDHAIKLAAEANVKSLEKIKASGKTKVYELTAAERNAFVAKMKPVYDKWTPKFGKETIDAARNSK